MPDSHRVSPSVCLVTRAEVRLPAAAGPADSSAALPQPASTNRRPTDTAATLSGSRTEQRKDAGSDACLSTRASEDAAMRRLSGRSVFAAEAVPAVELNRFRGELPQALGGEPGQHGGE